VLTTYYPDGNFVSQGCVFCLVTT